MRKRVDANTTQIVDALRKVGAVWISTTGDPSIGFDGIACKAGRTWLIEVKDGSRPPSARRLTDNESKRAYQLANVGVTVHVVNNTDEALRLIGVLT